MSFASQFLELPLVDQGAALFTLAIILFLVGGIVLRKPR